MNTPDPALYKTWRDWAATLARSQRRREANNPIQLAVYDIGLLPKATQRGLMIYVTGEVGGDVAAVSDGTNWRRVTDRAIVS